MLSKFYVFMCRYVHVHVSALITDMKALCGGASAVKIPCDLRYSKLNVQVLL